MKTKFTPAIAKQGFLLFIIFIISIEARAQFTYGYEFKPRRKKVEIPFDWQCNLMVVRVRINESDTLNFILDTGVGMNLITDPKVAESLKLHYIKKIDIMGAGSGEPLEAKIAIDNQIKMTGLCAKGQSLVALSQDVLALSEFIGIPIHGVFGYDVFRSFVVKINYSRRTITLYDPRCFKYKKNLGEMIPLKLEDNKPYIMAQSTMPDQKEISLKLILDTGAGHGLSLERSGNPNIILPDKTKNAHLGRGLSGSIDGQIGRISSFKIGTFELNNVIASFPDTNNYSNKILQRTGRQGNMGCEILKRFHVVFNYDREYIILKSNKKNFKEPFERDMSGLSIRAIGEQYNRFIIEMVEEGSPASMAGIKAGDEIISINNKLCNAANLNDIYKLFQKKEGKKMKLIMKSKNQIYFTEFMLKQMI